MTKQIKVSRSPDILILHLKRFDSVASKNDQLIQCPDDITLGGSKFQLTRFVLFAFLRKISWTCTYKDETVKNELDSLATESPEGFLEECN